MQKLRESFISHMVQIKHVHNKARAIVYFAFISHMVQIKRGATTWQKVVDFETALYPIWFR